ncbi:enoyl-CoA hydratase/isomerase family protein [Rhodococcus sp. NPDC059968]|uniref:enoyl-CoA hydratase/isomerase family protein n=1 Tax=Rhodococcus sp. NPDC059968 TaxID=3347017 RepID=UPI0036729789
MTNVTVGRAESAADAAEVRLEVDGGVATIVLARPRSLNAITPRLLTELADALALSATDTRVRVAVIKGEGTTFCAGFDLKVDQTTSGPDELRNKVERLHDITRAIRRAPFPVIASVQGFALGAGCELALCSDLVVASRDAQFGFPEVDVSLSVTGGISYLLPLAVGSVKAKELIFLGNRFSADDARAWNLINFVVDPDDLESETAALAARLASKPRLALTAAKGTLNAAAPGSIDQAYEIETGYAVLTQASAAASEAQASFSARRKGGNEE